MGLFKATFLTLTATGAGIFAFLVATPAGSNGRSGKPAAAKVTGLLTQIPASPDTSPPATGNGIAELETMLHNSGAKDPKKTAAKKRGEVVSMDPCTPEQREELSATALRLTKKARSAAAALSEFESRIAASTQAIESAEVEPTAEMASDARKQISDLRHQLEERVRTFGHEQQLFTSIEGRCSLATDFDDTALLSLSKTISTMKGEMRAFEKTTGKVLDLLDEAEGKVDAVEVAEEE